MTFHTILHRIPHWQHVQKPISTENLKKTESDAYEPTVQFAQVGSKIESRVFTMGRSDYAKHE